MERTQKISRKLTQEYTEPYNQAEQFKVKPIKETFVEEDSSDKPGNQQQNGFLTYHTNCQVASVQQNENPEFE
ncbi:UNKNOWN [Stylonychia lemnae]|uniref:Uncharacterized protein n=1 Tax=Stylonychia lemnae TaxID=5949 RepID=A0A078BEF7_STYLE|nr:UNKNOWN [Stylonychia lemnae]|eukprot:CDW91537.1 UNKNOWN [Stylonychia lemnae]